MNNNIDTEQNLTELISLRIEKSLRDELETEMRKQGCSQLSRYIRKILKKRKQRTGRTDTDSAAFTKAFDELKELYQDTFPQLQNIAKLKNPDGTYAVNTKEVVEIIVNLNDKTTEVVRQLQKLTKTGNDNNSAK